MAFPSVVLRLAFATAPFAATPTWTDISTDLISASIRRGRQHELDRIEAGTATLTLLNTSGNYWPDNTGGAYSPNVLPGKRINVRATYNAVTYDLFTGFIESWRHGFLAVPGKLPIVTVTAVDLTKNLSRLLLNDGTGYAQQRTDQRVGEVLDDLGWPAANRDLNVAQSTLIATGALANVNAESHLETAQQSELGLVFVAGDGDVQFQDRHARLKSPFLASSATFGDDAGEQKYRDAEFAYDDQYIYNDVRITRSGGAEQTAADSTSQTTYGKRSLSRTGLLMTTDGIALDQASWLLSRFKDPAFRLRSIVILPLKDEANLYPKVLSYDLSTRITVRLNAASLDKDYHIEGIAHDFDRNGHWETRWQVSDATSQEFWIIGTSKLGTGTRLAF